MSNKALTKKDFEEILKKRDKERFDRTTKTLNSISKVLNRLWQYGYAVLFGFMIIVAFLSGILYLAIDLNMFHTSMMFLRILQILFGFIIAMLIYSTIVDWLIKKRLKDHGE